MRGVQVQEDSELHIVLDRSTGTELGVDVDVKDGKGLIMEQITGGLVEMWNTSHPDKLLREGDRIVEVNNIRDDAQQLVTECKQNKVLEMRVLRRLPSGMKILSI
jgi:hypothetical protein